MLQTAGSSAGRCMGTIEATHCCLESDIPIAIASYVYWYTFSVITACKLSTDPWKSWEACVSGDAEIPVSGLGIHAWSGAYERSAHKLLHAYHYTHVCNILLNLPSTITPSPSPPSTTGAVVLIVVDSSYACPSLIWHLLLIASAGTVIKDRLVDQENTEQECD